MPVAQRKPDRDRDDPRAELAAAIADLAAAKQKVERHKAATQQMWHAMHEAEAAIAKAEKGIEDARAEHGRALADAAIADEDDLLPLRDDMTRLAVQSLADNRNSLEALKLGRAQQRRELPDLESDERAAAAAVEGCISAILAPIAADWIARLETLVREAIPYRSLLAGLLDSHTDRLVGFAGQRPIEPQLDAAGKLVWAHSFDGVAISSAPWAAARAALRADPDADIDDLLALPASPPANTGLT
jgi:hypothetical protein